MHLVFGVKNNLFAKMLFLYLSGRKPLNAQINYKLFLTKLMPFWAKAEFDSDKDKMNDRYI